MTAIDNTAQRHDHVLHIGALYALRYVVNDASGNPLDLTGYDVTCKARADFSSGSTLYDLDSRSSPSFITKDDDGNLNIDIPASVTVGYASGEYRFTINAWPTGNEDATIRLVDGFVTATPQVTT